VCSSSSTDDSQLLPAMRSWQWPYALGCTLGISVSSAHVPAPMVFVWWTAPPNERSEHAITVAAITLQAIYSKSGNMLLCTTAKPLSATLFHPKMKTAFRTSHISRARPVSEDVYAL